jgi:methyl-accepting chemotaxis protein
MLNIRQMRIDTRLGVGFTAILTSMCLLLAGVAINDARGHDLLAAIGRTGAQKDAAVAMRDALLSSAVAIRNIGLQTTVEGVQHEEAEARKDRTRFLDAKTGLEASGLGVDEKAIFGRLVEIDQQMAGHLKDAIELATMLNTEQDAAIITTKIDPLLDKSRKALDQFVKLQEQQVEKQIEETKRRRLVAEQLAFAVAVLVVLGAALLAWRLTVSIRAPWWSPSKPLRVSRAVIW